MSLSLYADALTDPAARRWVRFEDGSGMRLDVDRWIGHPDAGDASLLRLAGGPVLDVGCGPGRMVAALHAAGTPALGTDICGVAVDRARGSGAHIVHADVFGPVPRAGQWQSVLLVDGNIGIGGNPARRLARVRDLAVDDGRLLVETGPHGSRSGPVRARLAQTDRVGRWFPWGRLSADQLPGAGREADLVVLDQWEVGGRCFAKLSRT